MMELSFFAEMAWKSAAISGAALGLAYVLRSRSAADRTLVLRLGVALLLFLPLIALFVPALEIVAFAAPEALPATAYLPGPGFQAAMLAAADAAPLPPPSIWDDPTPLVLLAYLGGVAMVGARLVGGLWLLNRWTRASREVTCPEWLAAFDRVRWIAGNGEHVRLLVSDGVKSPLSWGWRNPVVLIDTDTLDQPDDADGILAHEMAHIARRDWPVLMLSRLVATLFWFNPLVWVLEREIVQQAEEAADCEAASRVEPTRYAETLLSWARVNGMVPANSIAPSTSALGRRVRAILDGKSRERPTGSAWTALAMLLCIGIATPVAAMKLVAASRQDVPEAPAAPAAPEAPRAVPLPPSMVAPDAPLPPEAPTAPDAPDAMAAPQPPLPPRPPRLVTVRTPEPRMVGPHVHAALAEVLPQIPQIVASAMASHDPREIEEALREAEQEMREAQRLNDREIRIAMAEARRATAVAVSRSRTVQRAEVQRAMRDAQRHAADARRHAANAQRQVRISMAHGADGMERGAAEMERGAQRMEDEARRLRNRDYREQQIARARSRGETVTHDDLIEAADGMREGAEGMREGAREMRESAREMRGRHS